LKKKGLIEKVRERRKDPLRRGPAVLETGAARKGMDGLPGLEEEPDKDVIELF
jgi:hypothetical protein